MKTIEECWQILEAQLPAGESLASGASDAAIREAESKMKVELPEDFRQFLARHDGSGECFIAPYKIGGGGQKLLNLAEILCIWTEKVEMLDEYGPQGLSHEQEGPIKPCWWNHRWIPFTDNECGDFIYLDFDPAKEGTSGQVVDWWHEPAKSTFQAASFREWLNEVADNVLTGVYKFGSEWPED